MSDPDTDAGPQGPEASEEGPRQAPNKFRRALTILNRGRDVLVSQLADEILEREEEYAEGGFLFVDFLESQGARLQFACVIAGQLEQAAVALEERQAEAEEGRKRAGRPGSRRRAPLGEGLGRSAEETGWD